MIANIIASGDRTEEFFVKEIRLVVDRVRDARDSACTEVTRSLEVCLALADTQSRYSVNEVLLFRSTTEELFSDIYGEYVAAVRHLPERVIAAELSNSALLTEIYSDELVAAGFPTTMRLRHYVFFLTDEIVDVVTSHNGLVSSQVPITNR